MTCHCYSVSLSLRAILGYVHSLFVIVKVPDQVTSLISGQQFVLEYMPEEGINSVLLERVERLSYVNNFIFFQNST